MDAQSLKVKIIGGKKLVVNQIVTVLDILDSVAGKTMRNNHLRCETRPPTPFK